jgi:hypothetical protein
VHGQLDDVDGDAGVGVARASSSAAVSGAVPSSMRADRPKGSSPGKAVSSQPCQV